jgi:hypothetical protein
MRSAIIAALATLAMVSVASAQNDQRVSDPSYVGTIHSPMMPDEDGSNAKSLTVEQENAIPYRPCMEPLGWTNGHLRCRND